MSIQFNFDGVATYQTRHTLPPTSGIYIAYLTGTILYVGNSGNIKRRCYQHIKLELIGQQYDDYEIYWWALPAEQRWAMEQKYIALFGPLYNER